jgi:pyrroline-5-carboxylate reductase
MKIGVIGTGAMGSALIRGLLKQGIVGPQDICASDIDGARAERLSKEAGVRALPDNASVAKATEVLLICVKPQQMKETLVPLRPQISPRHLVMSIAAGVRLQTIEGYLPEGTRVIRAMPNQACQVGRSATALSLGKAATEGDREMAERIFSSVGMTYVVEEELLDAVTGLSGSGPAYAYIMIDAMAQGGVEMGLPREMAVALAAQTLLGAATMVLETKRHPEELRDLVTSPGGTAIAGIRALEGGDFRSAVIRAVVSAAKRAKELSA